jgi:hypothetical protein
MLENERSTDHHGPEMPELGGRTRRGLPLHRPGVHAGSTIMLSADVTAEG